MADRHQYGDGAADDDLLLSWVEGGTAFLWTVGEQRCFYERGCAPPRRCIAAKKAGRGFLMPMHRPLVGGPEHPPR